MSTVFALGLAVVVTGPAFAAAPKTKANCEKAGMTWDDAAKKCDKRHLGVM